MPPPPVNTNSRKYGRKHPSERKTPSKKATSSSAQSLAPVTKPPTSQPKAPQTPSPASAQSLASVTKPPASQPKAPQTPSPASAQSLASVTKPPASQPKAPQTPSPASAQSLAPVTKPPTSQPKAPQTPSPASAQSLASVTKPPTSQPKAILPQTPSPSLAQSLTPVVQLPHHSADSHSPSYVSTPETTSSYAAQESMPPAQSSAPGQLPTQPLSSQSQTIPTSDSTPQLDQQAQFNTDIMFRILTAKIDKVEVELVKTNQRISTLEDIVDKLADGLVILLKHLKLQFDEAKLLSQHGTLNAIYQALEKILRDHAGDHDASIDVLKICRAARIKKDQKNKKNKKDKKVKDAEEALEQDLAPSQSTLIVKILERLEEKSTPEASAIDKTRSIKQIRNDLSHYTINRGFAEEYIETLSLSPGEKQAAKEIIDSDRCYELGDQESRPYFGESTADTTGYQEQKNMLAKINVLLSLVDAYKAQQKASEEAVLPQEQASEEAANPRPKPYSPGKDFPPLKAKPSLT